MAQAQASGRQAARALGRPRRTLRQRLRANSGVLFVLPAVLLFLIFGMYTVVYSAVLSFFDWNGFSGFSILPFTCEAPACRFIGLKNFRDFLYANPTISRFFWGALEHNLVIAVAGTAGTIAIALPLALALNRAARGQSLFRTAIMLPMVTSGIAVFYVWTFIYQPDGLLNYALESLGLGALTAERGWLGQPDRALGALIVVMVWGAVPSAVILYLSGLQTIDRELYEAAVLDGAGAWQTLRRITWPLLNRVTIIIVITSINGALQGYEMVYLMTNGGPASHTDVVGLQIFNYAFGDQRRIGMSAAMSWLLFVAVFGVALFNMRLFRPRD